MRRGYFSLSFTRVDFFFFSTISASVMHLTNSDSLCLCRKTLDDLISIFIFFRCCCCCCRFSSTLFIDSTVDIAGIESFFAALTLCGGSLSLYSDWDETIFPQRFCWIQIGLVGLEKEMTRQRGGKREIKRLNSKWNAIMANDNKDPTWRELCVALMSRLK